MNTSIVRGLSFAARADIAHATAVACYAFLDAATSFFDALEDGGPDHLSTKLRLVDRQQGAFSTLLTAWSRGVDVDDNLHIAACAIHGVAQKIGGPFGEADPLERWLTDALIEPLRRLPPPDQAVSRRQRTDLLEIALADPEMGTVPGCLFSFLDAIKAEGGASGGPAVQAAVTAVTAAISAALLGGVELGYLRAVLALWAHATGGPEITVGSTIQ